MHYALAIERIASLGAIIVGTYLAGRLVQRFALRISDATLSPDRSLALIRSKIVHRSDVRLVRLFNEITLVDAGVHLLGR
jgi:hypothetical protein